VVPTALPLGVLKQGILQKRSTGLVKQWQKRNFTVSLSSANSNVTTLCNAQLTKEKLHYENDKKGGKKNTVIDLWFAKKLLVKGVDITLQIGSETYDLKAADPEDATAWGLAFKEAVANAKKVRARKPMPDKALSDLKDNSEEEDCVPFVTVQNLTKIKGWLVVTKIADTPLFSKEELKEEAPEELAGGGAEEGVANVKQGGAVEGSSAGATMGATENEGNAGGETENEGTVDEDGVTKAEDGKPTNSFEQASETEAGCDEAMGHMGKYFFSLRNNQLNYYSTEELERAGKDMQVDDVLVGYYDVTALVELDTCPDDERGIDLVFAVDDTTTRKITFVAEDAKVQKTWAKLLSLWVGNNRKMCGLDPSEVSFTAGEFTFVKAALFSGYACMTDLEFWTANARHWKCNFLGLARWGLAVWDKKYSDMRSVKPKNHVVFTEGTRVCVETTEFAGSDGRVTTAYMLVITRVTVDKNARDHVNLIFQSPVQLAEWLNLVRQVIDAKQGRFSARLQEKDISLFENNEWINDQCVNWYFKFLELVEFADSKAELEHVHLLAPEVMSCIMLSCDTDAEKREVLKNVPLETCTTFIIPITDRIKATMLSSHWSLLVLSIEEKSAKFTHYDSKDFENGGRNGEAALRTAADLWSCVLLTEAYQMRPRETPDVSIKPCLQQINGDDCGVIALLCAKWALHFEAGHVIDEDDLSKHMVSMTQLDGPIKLRAEARSMVSTLMDQYANIPILRKYLWRKTSYDQGTVFSVKAELQNMKKERKELQEKKEKKKKQKEHDRKLKEQQKAKEKSKPKKKPTGKPKAKDNRTQILSKIQPGHSCLKCKRCGQTYLSASGKTYFCPKCREKMKKCKGCKQHFYSASGMKDRCPKCRGPEDPASPTSPSPTSAFSKQKQALNSQGSCAVLALKEKEPEVGDDKTRLDPRILIAIDKSKPKLISQKSVVVKLADMEEEEEEEEEMTAVEADDEDDREDDRDWTDGEADKAGDQEPWHENGELSSAAEESPWEEDGKDHGCRYFCGFIGTEKEVYEHEQDCEDGCVEYSGSGSESETDSEVEGPAPVFL
jgi:hypothetical protein